MLQRVFVDSNVLASRTQYDWLFMLRNETDSMFQLHSSFDVLVEAVRVWRRRNPAARGSTSKRRFDHLLANLDEVIDDFDAEIDFDGDDAGDIHVNAAAVASGAHKLLTMNGRDFGDPDLLPYEIYTPDQFFCLVDDGADACVRRVTMKKVNYWNGQRDGGRSTKPLVDALRSAGCPEFATRVSGHLRVLAGQQFAAIEPEGRLREISESRDMWSRNQSANDVRSVRECVLGCVAALIAGPVAGRPHPVAHRPEGWVEER